MLACPLPVERVQVIPEWREDTGSLGSATLEVSGGDREVLGAIVDCLARRFRKSWYDLARGVAVFMAPSGMHESHSRESLELVRALCECQGLAVVGMGATTARAPHGAGADPDESFFIGRRAERFLEIRRSSGLEAAVAEMENEPRDLVVEVEHSHRDQHKRGIYRDAGVSELWELATRAAGRAPAIWDLLAPDAPVEMDQSRVLPGVRADALPAAMAELAAVGGLVGLVRGMARGEAVDRRLLTVAGVTPAHR